MSDAELTEIFELCVLGKTLENWGGHQYSDVDTLRQLQPPRMFARKRGGSWTELP